MSTAVTSGTTTRVTVATAGGTGTSTTSPSPNPAGGLVALGGLIANAVQSAMNTNMAAMDTRIQQGIQQGIQAHLSSGVMPATTTSSGPPTATWPAGPPTYPQAQWYGPPPGYPPVLPWTYPPVGPTAPPVPPHPGMSTAPRPPVGAIPAMSSHPSAIVPTGGGVPPGVVPPPPPIGAMPLPPAGIGPPQSSVPSTSAGVMPPPPMPVATTGAQPGTVAYGCMPPPAAIAGVPIFSAAGPTPMLTAPTMTSYGYVGGAPPLPSLQPGTSGTTNGQPAIAPSGVGIPSKLAQKIWGGGEFVEMFELLPEKLGQADSHPSTSKEDKKKRDKRVANILQWVECFHTYVGVLVQTQPTRTQDLLAYASLVVHAARKFKGDGWATYDRNFRKKAAAHQGIKWGDLDMPLWALAFCNAEAREHCAICMSIDHDTRACEDYDSPDEERTPKSKSSGRSGKSRGREASQEKQPICIKWNRSNCTSATCEYRHVCLDCHQHHKERDCPSGRKRYSPYPREKPRKEDGKPFPRKGSK